jgi:hypothetical protein
MGARFLSPRDPCRRDQAEGGCLLPVSSRIAACGLRSLLYLRSLGDGAPRKGQVKKKFPRRRIQANVNRQYRNI